jgi:hypothetical protein
VGRNNAVGLRNPDEAAHLSGMMPPALPKRCRSPFRDDVAHPSGAYRRGASAALLDPQGRFPGHCPKEVTNASRGVSDCH